MKNIFKKHKHLVHIFIICLLLFIYFSFRLYNHSERVNFAEDQGIILQDTLTMWQDMKPRLIGPKVSHGFAGRFFFHGPYVYYFLLPGLLLFNWIPIGGSVITIAWNSIGIILLYILGVKAKSKKLGILLALIYATNSFLMFYTSFVWNPNLLPLVSIIATYLLLDKKSSNFKRNVFLLGIVSSVGMLLHYQMVFFLPLVMVYIYNNKKDFFLNSLRFVTGFIIGFSPFIIFEIKHSFYNLKTMIAVASNYSSDSSGTPVFYFMVPIICLSILLVFYFYNKVLKNNKKIILNCLTFILIINAIFGVKSLLTKANVISYNELNSASEIIINTEPSDFNIVNLTTGNTRANALRYILEYKNLSPMGVENYPQADILYVLSKHKTNEEIQQDPVWEVSSFKGVVVQKWQLINDSEYYLYKLLR